MRYNKLYIQIGLFCRIHRNIEANIRSSFEDGEQKTVVEVLDLTMEHGKNQILFEIYKDDKAGEEKRIHAGIDKLLSHFGSVPEKDRIKLKPYFKIYQGIMNSVHHFQDLKFIMNILNHNKKEQTGVAIQHKDPKQLPFAMCVCEGEEGSYNEIVQIANYIAKDVEKLLGKK